MENIEAMSNALYDVIRVLMLLDDEGLLALDSSIPAAAHEMAKYFHGSTERAEYAMLLVVSVIQAQEEK